MNPYRNADCEKTQAPPMCPADPNDYRLKQRVDELYAGNACSQAPMSDSEILSALFRYHPPTDSTIPKFAAINQAAKNFAEVVLQNCPASADRSAAIRSIRDARMTANAAVALNGLSL